MDEKNQQKMDERKDTEREGTEGKEKEDWIKATKKGNEERSNGLKQRSM